MCRDHDVVPRASLSASVSGVNRDSHGPGPCAFTPLSQLVDSAKEFPEAARRGIVGGAPPAHLSSLYRAAFQ